MLQVANKPAKHYSPLRYPGGKACLSEFLTDVIEENKLSESTYAEPYAGGAGAALTLLILEKVERIIINDLDRAIYAFWVTAINNSDKLIRKIERISLSMNEWNLQKEIYRSNTKDEFKLGFATFYLNRTNRSGIIEGGPIGGVKQKGKWKIDARFNRAALIDRIDKIAQYKNRIKITNKDGIEFIKSLCKKENIFSYLDPPYFIKGSSLYLNHYKKHDHKDLAEVLNENRKMNWILTYDNVPEIQILYQKRKKLDFTLNYHADIAKKGHELLIHSDKIKIPKNYY
jgi:DNA adenine methylase